MKGQTMTTIRAILSRVKDPVTKKPSFRNNDEVIDAAVSAYFDELKRQKVLGLIKRRKVESKY